MSGELGEPLRHGGVPSPCAQHGLDFGAFPLVSCGSATRRPATAGGFMWSRRVVSDVFLQEDVCRDRVALQMIIPCGLGLIQHVVDSNASFHGVADPPAQD